MRRSKPEKINLDNQAFWKDAIKQELILAKLPIPVPCMHKYQHVEQIGRKHVQICFNKKCQRRLIVR